MGAGRVADDEAAGEAPEDAAEDAAEVTAEELALDPDIAAGVEEGEREGVDAPAAGSDVGSWYTLCCAAAAAPPPVPAPVADRTDVTKVFGWAVTVTAVGEPDAAPPAEAAEVEAGAPAAAPAGKVALPFPAPMSVCFAQPPLLLGPAVARAFLARVVA